MKRLTAAALIALTVAGTAGAARPSMTERQQADLERVLAGRTAERPTSCIYRPTNQHVTAYGDGTLVFGDYDRVIYRNDPRHECNGAGRDGIIVTRSTIGQICRGDIVTIIDRTSRFPVGSCTLGDFVPYRKAAKNTRRP